MRSYSPGFKRALHATGGSEAPLILLEVIHQGLTEPARVCLDNDDFPYGAAHVWKPNHMYADGEIVVPSIFNGRFYEVTTAGTSGPSEPVWPTGMTVTQASGAAVFTTAGVQYKAMHFRLKLPDDKSRQMPRALISIDNVGRELAAWLEISGGGIGSQCRIIQVLRSDPDTIEWEITMDLTNLSMNAHEIAGQLGFDDILNKPAVALTYRPDVAPGLF